jgi:molybdenum cofactor cytidylyltransferase
VKITAILLAAGRSTRFEDGHKLLAEIDSVPLIRRAALSLAHSSVEDIVLITATSATDIAAAAGPGRWRHIENPSAAEGLSSSLRLGIQSAKGAEGILVALADMPGITAELVDTLCAAFTASEGRGIVFPIAPDGRRGHPVIWPRSLFSALESVSGDTGGKALLAGHRDLWRPVECNDPGAFTDIDTRTDLDTFAATRKFS